MKASEFAKQMKTAGTVISAPAAPASKKSGAAAFAEKNQTKNSPGTKTPMAETPKPSDEERRAQIVEVTDLAKPDAAPVRMTMGEYEDMVAAERRAYDETVKANSRLRAMSVHESRQHGAELADKRQQEFVSRYKVFTPKERRMHGAEAPTVEELQPAIYNAAKAKAAAGDYAGAQELLREGYASGLYGQDAFIGAYGDIISNRSVTPETRLAGLKKAAEREAEKKQRAQAAFADAGTTRDQRLASGAKELLGSVNPQYQKMYGRLHERVDSAPHEQKKAEKEGERDAAYSAAIWQLDEELARLKAEAAPLVEAEKAAWKNAGDLYTAIDYTSADASARQEEYIKAHDAALAAKRAVTDNEAQIFYINGLKSFAELSENDRLQFVQYIRGGDYKETYKRIKASMGKDDFERMVDTVAALENAVKAAERDIGTAKFAAMHPVMGSLASVFTSLIGGVSAAAGVIAHGIDNLGEGEGYKAPIDTNGLAFAPTKHATVTRETVASDIARDVGGKGGKVAAFLYQTGMSGVDSLAASFTGNWGGALLLGTSAASNAFLDAKERGVSDSQAIWTGLFAGVFETLFERVSIGNLNALKDTPVATFKDILGNLGKSALVNASEEMLTEAANAISDYMINADLSAFGSMYEELIAEGISPEEARRRVKTAFWQQNLEAAAGGALMGIGFAGATGAVNYFAGSKANAELGSMYKNADGSLNAEAVQALVNEAAASENGEIREYARSIQNALAKGKSVDERRLGALQRALAAEQNADAKQGEKEASRRTGAETAAETEAVGTPINVLSNEAFASAFGVSRGNVLVPNGDGTNSLVPVEKAERRQTKPAEQTGKSANARTLDAIGKSRAAIGADDMRARVAMKLSAPSNTSVDHIINTPALARAFTELTGVELSGMMAQKRRTVRENAAAGVEKYRMEHAQSTARAVQGAGYQNSTESMIGEGGALGRFGAVAYRRSMQATVDAYTRSGLGNEAVKHYNAEFGAYYRQGLLGGAFEYQNSRMSEADARAAYNAGKQDTADLDRSVTERSGELYGASREEIDTAKRLSRLFGKDVIFVNVLGLDDFNGCYIGDGDIYLQVGAKNPIVQVAAHEFVHSLESKALYGKLRDFVFKVLTREGKTEDELRAEKRAKRGYAKLGNEDLDYEIVAAFVAEKLLTDEKVIRVLVREEGKPFVQQLHDFWNAFVAKIKSVFGKTDEVAMLERGRELLAKVIKSEEVGESGGLRNMYAGENAKTANVMKLEDAMRMEKDGTDAEEIRKATGWHKGYDGKWRFEIDDSKMRIFKDGDALFSQMHPEYVELQELYNKMFYGNITESEYNRLQELDEIWGREYARLAQRVDSGNATLENIIQHDALFEAYPELRNVKVVFEGMESGTHGSYVASKNEITINELLLDSEKKLKETLLHEIQHVVQHIEGFSKGASPEYWAARIKESDAESLYTIDEEIKHHAKKLEALEKEAGYVEFESVLFDKLMEDEISQAQYDAEIDAFMDENRALKKATEHLFELRRLRAETARRIGPMSNPETAYRNTAGEIEARDVSARSDLDTERRKNTRPDIDRSDVVFEDGTVISKDFAGWTVDGNEVYITSPNVMNLSHSDRIKKFQKDFLSNFKGRTAKFTRNGHVHYARFAENRKGLGKLTYEGNSKSSPGGYTAKLRMLADGNVFELVEDSKYDGTEQEKGKNKKNHKNAKFWDYYLKTIIVDGKGYDVIVNVRLDTANNDFSTKEEYVYSIRFTDNKTVATSILSPADSKLLSQVDVTTNTNVPQNTPVVNTQSMQELQNDVPTGEGTDSDIRYSFASDEAEEHHDAAVAHFGRTSKWEATGYLLTDGTRLDLSGGHGRRTYGHHVIGKAIGIDGGMRGQIRFMQEGNVRVSPELPGIELNATTEPTEEQYGMLARFVDKVADGESFAVDFTDKDGKYLDTIEYEGGLYADDVLADIRQFYRNGAIRKPSELSRFRYSFAEDAPKMPNGEDVPTEAEIEADPIESAIKMFRGGMNPADVRIKTGQIPMEMAAKLEEMGYDAAEIREITGMYRNENGAWKIDYKWIRAHDKIQNELRSEGQKKEKEKQTKKEEQQKREEERKKISELRLVYKELFSGAKKNIKEAERAFSNELGDMLGLDASERKRVADSILRGYSLRMLAEKELPDGALETIISSCVEYRDQKSKYRHMPKIYTKNMIEEAFDKYCRVARSFTAEFARARDIAEEKGTRKEAFDALLAESLYDNAEDMTGFEAQRAESLDAMIAEEPLAEPEPTEEDAEFLEEMAKEEERRQHEAIDANTEENDEKIRKEMDDFLSELEPQAPEVSAEDEFLLSMLYYQDNPDKADEVILEHELGGTENFIDRMIHTKTDEAMRREAEKAKKGKERRDILKKNFREELAKSASWLQRKFVDSGYAVSQIEKSVRDSRLYAYYNAARASTNAAVYMLTDAQTDVDGRVVGDGLNAIFAPIKEQGDDYYRDFEKYLYHLHNADRMSRQNDERTAEAKLRFATFKSEHPELRGYAEYQLERIAESEIGMPEQEAAAEYIRLRDEMRREENMRNKPIFGHEVDASHSTTAALALERLHPEFKEHRDKVYKYIENLLQYRVDTGLITAEDMEQLKSIYPHYVPTYRVTDPNERAKQRKNRNVTVGKAIGRAVGGDEALMPLDQALAKLTMRVVREGTKNNFGRRLMYNGAVKLKEHIKNVSEYKPQGQTDAFANADAVDGDVDPAFRKTNSFVIHDGGQMWELEIGDALFEAVQALSPTVEEMSALEKFARGANKLYKELITGKNPLFIVKNFVRDLQDAGLYTENFGDFAKAYPRAWAEVTKNSELWRQYQALGGLYSSFFDYKTGTAEKKHKKGLGRIGEVVEYANMLIEQMPRFAEFLATVERGGTSHDNLMTAMHNAADVTVNFGRSGTWGKYLNATIIPFFNPGIQGLDKTVRVFKENHGVKEWSALVAKALLLGVAPSVINALAAAIFDWDGWDEIKERDKDVNYLIYVGDGKYVKIPKGRVTAALSMTAARVFDVVTGEEVNFGEYISTMADQIAPANPFESNIVMPWIQTALFDPENPGKTWYGSDIESQRLRNYAPAERYDEKTDVLSRALGKVTGLSPKKINYLLDSYSGVAGDILLPALVPSSGGFDAIGKVFAKTFVLDSVSSNRLNNDFYTMLDSVTYNKNSVDATPMDKLLYRYMSKRSQAVSEVNAAIRELEGDTKISNKDRAELLRAQQMLRNTVEQNAMDQISAFYRSAEYFYSAATGNEDEKLEWAYLMANREVFGAEYAIETYNKSTYKKARECHAEGVSYEDFFDYYFAASRVEGEGYEKNYKKRELLMKMRTDEDTKISLYRAYISDSRDDDIKDFSDAGLDFGVFLRVQNEHERIKAKYKTTKERSQAFAEWVKKQKFSAKQNVVVLDCFK